MAAVSIERTSVDSEEGHRLFTELWAEVDKLYENDVPSRSQLVRMNDPRAAFVVARYEGTAVGCGAIRPRSQTIAEVKRVYVQPRATCRHSA